MAVTLVRRNTLNTPCVTEQRVGDSFKLKIFHLPHLFQHQNLLLDDMKDFSTLRDDIGKEKQRQLTLEKKKRY